MYFTIKLIKRAFKLAKPNERKAVLSNAASLTALQAITNLLPIVILPYLFRVLGPEKFGLIAFAQAFVQYFMILTDYGFSISATKEISLCQHKHEEVCRVFSTVMTVKIALAFLSLLLLGMAVYFIPKFRSDWLVYCLSFGAVLGNTIFPVWFFQGTEKMKHITDLSILGGVIFTLFIFLFVHRPEDYLLVPIIYSLVSLIVGFLGQYIVFKRFRVAFRFEGYANVRQQLKAGWDIFISILAINAYTTTRVFTIGLLTNNATTGFYAIAERIAGVCQTFPLTSFSQAVFPRLSKIFHKNKARAWALMQHIQQITTNISLMCLPAIFLFAPFIIRVICGKDYPDTILSFRLLLIAVFFVSANAFRVQFLLVCGKTPVYSRIHVVMAMIGLPIIFLLVSSFGYAGAGIATIIIETGIFIITYLTVRKLNLS